ncbi:MAG: hypothetical protein RI885_1695 [Actinomycetota bacterium]|jgi:putative hydrolase of the HAD superfamily
MLLFIFDMDDVLYRYDWRVRMARMTELTGLSFEELRARWWHDEGEIAAEAGAWTSGAAYLRAFTAAIGVTVDEGEWIAARRSGMTPIAESIEATARAAELGQVTLLTNNGALLGHHLPVVAPELVPIFGEHLFSTSHYGARKPDPAVFSAVLERYGVEADQAFFADDLPENIAGAASVGISTHLFSDGAAMHRAIEDFAASQA